MEENMKIRENTDVPKAVFCSRCGYRFSEHEKFCTVCGEARAVVRTEEPMSSLRVQESLTTAGIRESEGNGGAYEEKQDGQSFSYAVLTGIAVIFSWILYSVIFRFFYERFMINHITSDFIILFLLGTAVYLSTCADIKSRILSCVYGFLSLLMFSADNIVLLVSISYEYKLTELLKENKTFLVRNFVQNLIVVGLTLGTAFLIGYLLKTKEKKRRERIVYLSCASVLGAAYLIQNLLIGIRRAEPLPFAFSLHRSFINLSFGFVLFLAALLISKICRKEKSYVKLGRGGLFWSWFAMIGMFFSIVIFSILLFVTSEEIPLFIGNILLLLSGFVSYLLLILKKRKGLYLLLSACVIVLFSNFSELIYLILRKEYGAQKMFLGNILGGLNPLLAWLCVISASGQKEKTGTDSIKKSSGFDKFTAIFNLVIGLIIIIFPLPFIILSHNFHPSMLVFILGGLLSCCIGILSLIAQKNKSGPFPLGLKIASIVFFVLLSLFIFFSVIMFAADKM